MSDLSKKSFVELRQLCVAAGIPTKGRLKAELVASLKEREETEQCSEEVVLQNAQGGGTDSEENELTEEGDSGDIEQADAEACASDPPDIIALKLKLQLAKVELQTQQVELQTQQSRERQVALNAGSGSVVAATEISPLETHVRGALPKMGPEDDNVIAFFSAFERCLELYGVEKSAYCRLLPGCLSSKAFKVYSNLNKQQALDYKLTKKQILASLKLDALSYLTKFRSARRSGSESYALFANRLQDLLHYYIDSKGITTFEALKSDLLLITFIETLPIAVKSLVLSKRVKDIFEAADQADLAFQIEQERSRANSQRNFSTGSRENSNWMKNNTYKSGNFESKKEICKNFQPGDDQSQTSITCFNCGKSGHKKSACPDLAKKMKTGSGNLKVPTCFSCGEKGHEIGSSLRKKSQNSQNNQHLLVQDDVTDSMKAFIIPCFINGIETKALRDSGADVVLLCEVTFKDVVTPIPGKFIRISGITGQSEQIPVAEVNIFSPHFKQDKKVKIIAGLVKNRNLREKVILGNRLFQLHPELTDILAVNREPEGTVSTVSMVVTRSKSTVNENDGQQSTIDEIGVSSNKHGDSESLSGVGIDDVQSNQNCTEQRSTDISPKISPGFSQSTQQTRENMLTTIENVAVDGCSEQTDECVNTKDKLETHNVDVCENEFKRLSCALNGQINTDGTGQSSFVNEQHSDDGLKKFFELAKADNQQFFVDNGLLYHRVASDWGTDGNKLLVVPSHFIRDVLQTAHDAMFAGAHNGAFKVTQRIKAAGLWFENMFQWCKQWHSSCEQCQKLATIRKSHRVPMNETPIIGEVFSELSVDVCGGDWPITPRRKKYLLTVQCTASRYAWAIPLTNLKAKTLATKLMHLFASIGSLKVLKLDSAAQWRGSLVTELTKLLGVTCNVATAFHHQSIGGVERLNQTIERMAKSYISENPTGWDIYIDYFMFAYMK
jgi:hypothetical protein